jgi:hypothetical protein
MAQVRGVTSKRAHMDLKSSRLSDIRTAPSGPSGPKRNTRIGRAAKRGLALRRRGAKTGATDRTDGGDMTEDRQARGGADKARIARQFIEAIPFSKALGMRLDEIGDGVAVISMPYDPAWWAIRRPA